MRIYPNPKFSCVSEEDEFWATHSPIDEGYYGAVQKKKQKRSSLLLVPFAGDELTKLKEMASKKGVNPSAYVSTVVKDLLNSIK